MSSITVRLDFPPVELTPNFRTKKRGWVDAVKRSYRYTCYIDARNARDCKTTYPLRAPLKGHATFYVTRGTGPDPDNALASLKSGIDGIADAGVIGNDRDVSWSSEVVRKALKREVVVTISEVLQ
jgi:hypothetical protein